MLAMQVLGCANDDREYSLVIKGAVVDRFIVKDNAEYDRLYEITFMCVSMFKDDYPVYDNRITTEVVIIDGEISYKGIALPGWTEDWDTDHPVIYLSDTTHYELVRHEFEHAILRMGAEGHDLEVFKLCAYQGGN